jgi:endonuclease I
MKKHFTLLLLSFVSLVLAQAGSPATPYYSGVNWSLTGMNLKSALSLKITNTHTNFLTYAQDWNATQATDLNPTNSSNVLLLYGFSSSTCPSATSNDNDHRERNSLSNGGGNVCEWNREHVYAKSLGTPPLVDGASTSADSDAGEDAHHLRSCDVDRNGNRGNLKFAPGSGNSGQVSGGWYPGDEWKGDVARMMMYMYLRYPTQCLPINVGTGTTVSTDTNMIQLFLQWNAEDPVSPYEDNRNTYHGNTNNTYAQGNRNPFIDNPYLATVIWGGPAAQNRWPSTILASSSFASIVDAGIYPNPATNNEFFVATATELKTIVLYTINGQMIQKIDNPLKVENDTYKISNLPKGFYLVQLSSDEATTTRKVLLN